MSATQKDASRRLAAALIEELDDSAVRSLAGRLHPYLHDEPDRLLNAREAATLLGLHPETLARMARAGRIWAVKAGRAWRFRADRLQIGSVPVRDLTPTSGRPHHRSGRARGSVAAIRGVDQHLR